MYDRTFPSRAEKNTDSLTVHDRSISFDVRQERISHVHQWYRLARHVSTSQSNAVGSTKGSVEHWLAGLEAPDSQGPGKQSTIIGKGDLLKGTKMKQQPRTTPPTVIATHVG